MSPGDRNSKAKETYMNIVNKIRQLFDNFAKIVRQTFDFIAAAARRIFAPTDDKYPATGIQPFEGDIYEERREKRHQN
jgi:hypothetical protein